MFDSEPVPLVSSSERAAFAFTFSRGRDEQAPSPLRVSPRVAAGLNIIYQPVNPVVIALRALKAIEE